MQDPDRDDERVPPHAAHQDAEGPPWAARTQSVEGDAQSVEGDAQSVEGDAQSVEGDAQSVEGTAPEGRGWTQAEIDAEIARLGDVPMYHPDTGADDSPGSPDSSTVPVDRAVDPDATAVHRPFDVAVRSSDTDRGRAGGTATAADTSPDSATAAVHGPGSTAAQRLTAYGWLFGQQRQPTGPRPPLWRHAGADPDAAGPDTAPMTPVGAARVHPVASAVPRPSPTRRPATPPAQGAGARTVAAPSRPNRRRRSRRGVMAVLVLAICLSLGTAAAIVGHRLSADGAPLAGLTGRGSSATPEPAVPAPGRVWDGAVAPVTGVTATAECVDAPGNDNGTPVPYVPANLLDDDPETAWRCTEHDTPTVTFQLPEDALIAEVGLVNGYAKDVDGTDRYPLYERALLVRWTFADGTSITQELSDDTRTVQRMRIPVRAGGEVTLQILKVSNPSVQSATRDSVALSGVVFLGPDA